MNNEQAGAGRDDRTCLARPKFKARTGTGKYSFFPVELTTSRIGSLARLIHNTLLKVLQPYAHTLVAASKGYDLVLVLVYFSWE